MEDTLSVPPHAAKRVSIVFNLKRTDLCARTVDAQAELDSIDTVNAIGAALSAAGYEVSKVEADKDFVKNIKSSQPDIVFNIAEGLNGRGREAQVPAILDFLNIPYTGSDETTLAICLDKALTKRLVSTYKVRTPKGVVATKDAYNTKGLKYPVIVKPNAEGSSKGISGMSVAANACELKKLLKYDFENYDGDMLVEQYIKGREFTVALLGNGDDVIAFSPLEIVFVKDVGKYKLYSYDIKKEFEKYVRLDCPPILTVEKQEEIKAVAKKIFKVLNCRDFARMDFMMDEEEKLYFIEINPLPGLAPGYSDFPFITQKCGINYNTTIARIIATALNRL